MLQLMLSLHAAADDQLSRCAKQKLALSYLRMIVHLLACQQLTCSLALKAQANMNISNLHSL